MGPSAALRQPPLVRALALTPPLVSLLATPLSMLFTMSRAAAAAELNLTGVSRYGSSEQVTSIAQFSDVKPSDWAYQALSNLLERYGCVAGYPNGSYKGGQAISRFEAAALLNVCLERVSETTDELRKLLKHFEKELAILRGRVDGLDARVGALEATRFSTTSKLSGQATFVVGANAFGGTATALLDTNRADFGATTFNYDVQLFFDTSFTGKDLLRTKLRAGNFDGASNAFGGGGPASLGQLEVAFQEDSGANVLGIDRLYYQFPVGAFTITLGGRVEQNDMLAMYPSVYPNTSVLNMFTMAGSPVAYDLNLGPGAGIWWKGGAWSVSVNYIAQDAANGNPADGGIGTLSSRASTTVQLGHVRQQWAMAFVYSAIQGEVGPYSTAFMEPFLQLPGMVHTLGLSGYWQPLSSGWLPSISAGAEISQFDYVSPLAGSADQAVAWSVGLQWLDVLATGNSGGMALGQAPHATRLLGGAGVNDANWMWEWWYQFQLSDSVSVTPALFVLSRPLGQDTPANQSFNQLGGLVKTTFRF